MKLQYSFGIAAKLILVVSSLIIAAIGIVLLVATDLFREESLTRIQENNKDHAKYLSERVYSSFQNISQDLKIMAQFTTNSMNAEEAVRAIENSLSGNDDIISFVAYQLDEKGQAKRKIEAFSQTALSEFNITAERLITAVENNFFSKVYKYPDDFVVTNSGPQTALPLFTVGFMSAPEYYQAKNQVKKEHPLAGRWLFRAEVRQSSIQRIFPKRNSINSFLVSSDGTLLAHSSPSWSDLVIKAANFSYLPIVAQFMENSLSNHQMEYEDAYGNEYLGAFKAVGVANIGVVTEVEKSEALATIERVQHRSILVMVIVVCLAFFINFAFSNSITKPLSRLFLATEQIVNGNFNVSLKNPTSDEIGALSQAFNGMVKGLKERDKIKTAFGKFHSKEVANKLLSGEITLGGERKQATVFFSDIRGFTSMSENMSPDEVVRMLNSYMTEMVSVIYKWNGVVDKYIGDAIMGVWGVPETNIDDAYNAVRCCLEMREMLIEFNEKRKVAGETQIEIGMGLHSGMVLAGNIGSEERLEYTIIGDTVNLASRIEGANKAVEGDLLISSQTYSLVKDRGIIVGPAIPIKAKGKSTEVFVHEVIGYKAEDGSLKTVYSEQEISLIQNKTISVAAEEESKTQIAGIKENGNTPSLGEPVLNPQFPPVQYPQQVSLQNQIYNTPSMPSVQPAFHQQASTDMWYVKRRGENNVNGPFTGQEINLRLGQGLILPDAQAFRDGDEQLINITQVPGVERRGEMPSIQLGVPQQRPPEMHAWYVYGPNGATLGPYNEQELEFALQQGNLGRTTYVWRPGMESWIYLFQIPGFDRRTVA